MKPFLFVDLYFSMSIFRRMMGDHPNDLASFPEDRISVRLQPRREARADTREPDFKYPA